MHQYLQANRAEEGQLPKLLNPNLNLPTIGTPTSYRATCESPKISQLLNLRDLRLLTQHTHSITYIALLRDVERHTLLPLPRATSRGTIRNTMRNTSRNNICDTMMFEDVA